MKKITKILPLVLFPSLIMVACNKANNTNQDAVSNINGITEFEVTVDLNGGKVGESSEFKFSVRDGTYYSYFETNLPAAEQISRPGYTFTHYSIPGVHDDKIPPTYRFRGDVTIVAQYTPKGVPHTVTWKNYDGSELAQETYYKEETPEYKGDTPEHASVPGKSYTFAGWEPAIAPVEDADQTYTAQFDEIVDECVVSFDTKGGSAIAPILVNKGGKIATAPENPTKEGYVFKKETGHSGWLYNKGGDQTYEFVFGTTTVESDMTLYCEWEVNQFDATFVPNGGTWSGESGTGNKVVATDFGVIPTLDETISFTGHTFAGWKRTSDGGIGLVPMTATGETYTAQWIPQHAITIDDTIENGDISVNPTSAIAGTTIVGTVSPDSGYHCTEVKVATGTLAISYTPGDSTFTFVMPDAAVTLTATFVADPVAHSINGSQHVGHGTILTDSSAVAGTTIVGVIYPDNGYHCTDINVTTSTGGTVGRAYHSGDAMFSFEMPDADVTITATYEADPVAHTITIEAIGGSVTTNPSGSAFEGTVITGTVTPDDDCTCNAVAVTTEDGSVIVNYNPGEKFFTFEMPGKDVIITPSFVPATTDAQIAFTSIGDIPCQIKDHSGAVHASGSVFSLDLTDSDNLVFTINEGGDLPTAGTVNVYGLPADASANYQESGTLTLTVGATPITSISIIVNYNG